MKNKVEQTVEEYGKQLDQLNILHEFIEHPAFVEVSDVMNFLGLPLKLSSATLLMKADDDYVALIRRGDTRLDLEKTKKLLSVKKLNIASKEEFSRLTGLEPGAAHYLTGFKTFIDRQVLENEYVYGGSGSLLVTTKYKSSDLTKIPNSVVVDITAGDALDSLERSDNKRILSGITPSGNALHIGNYFGAVKPQIELQNRNLEVYYFVADLHALTTVKDREKLEDNITNVVLDYLALGLDPEKCVFFRQSQVPAHSQLAVVLANYISFGQMQRMHAFKDKLQFGAEVESINMGLFNYPILMAADILLYKPYGVPVGEDQRQHIELTRDIAGNFNKTYSNDLFPLPEPLISKETGKIVGTDGTRKMSKSLGNVIGIFDDYEVIKKQIMSAYTDPNRKRATDPGKIEGNTVFMYHDIINQNKDMVEEMKTKYKAGEIGDVEVKEKLVEAHKLYFAEARARRKEFEGDLQLVKNILLEGSKKASTIANTTLEEAYKLIGIKNKLN
ncbi:MAG: tryptophan--tRNA ligase [Candidatus Woesebacteria bacterium]|nr:MAG: tryptophan--tRNA ligase [Candidatus Woesebacteria bacterium]